MAKKKNTQETTEPSLNETAQFLSGMLTESEQVSPKQEIMEAIQQKATESKEESKATDHVNKMNSILEKAIKTGIEETDITKYEFKNFLPVKKIQIKRITDNANFYGKSFEGELPPGYMPDIAKKLELPRNNSTGSFIQIFDTVTKYRTPQFPKEPMTELEFFARMLGVTPEILNPLNSSSDFWKGRRAYGSYDALQPYTAVIQPSGRTLDLSDINDALDYKIIKVYADNYSINGGISPNWHSRKLKNFVFALVDDTVETDVKEEKRKIEIQAITIFNNICDNKEALIDFIITMSPNNVPPANADLKWLRNRVWDVVKENPKLIIATANDPDKEDKLLIHYACKAGVIKKMGQKYYTMAEEPLGTVNDIFALLRDPEKHFQVRMKWEAAVDEYKKLAK